MDFGEYIKNCIVIEKYNTKDFIKTDPIQFPRRLYDCGMDIKDIEISAIISSWLSYGSRKAFLPIIRILHEKMDWQPYKYIESKKWERYMNNEKNLYRFYTWNDFYVLCSALHTYCCFLDFTIEEVIKDHPDPITGLIKSFDTIKGFPKDKRSACKRICMLLRWMIRDDGIVDMGLWKFPKSELIIPLDTHVHKTALKYGITNRKQADMKTAVEITNFFKRIFPEDPAKGDFALYGLGIDNEIKVLTNENH